EIALRPRPRGAEKSHSRPGAKSYDPGVPLFRRLLSMVPGVAPVDFKPLSRSSRAALEQWLSGTPQLQPVDAIVAALDAGRGRFAVEYARVLDEVKRRCEGAAIWQNLYLDLLDDEGVHNDEG